MKFVMKGDMWCMYECVKCVSGRQIDEMNILSLAFAFLTLPQGPKLRMDVLSIL